MYYKTLIDTHNLSAISKLTINDKKFVSWHIFLSICLEANAETNVFI